MLCLLRTGEPYLSLELTGDEEPLLLLEREEEGECLLILGGLGGDGGGFAFFRCGDRLFDLEFQLHLNESY